jgi:hypothetical protein
MIWSTAKSFAWFTSFYSPRVRLISKLLPHQ